MTIKSARFAVGQIIHNTLFDYRGVIIDVDPHFRGTEEWYSNQTRSKPPKDSPWYHVLVDGARQRTYVAERNLEADASGAPVNHRDVRLYFDGMGDNGYIPRRKEH